MVTGWSGNILLLYENPNKNVGMPECCNVIMADNEALRDYIKTGFIEKLGTFSDVPAYSASSQLKIDKVVTEETRAEIFTAKL